MPIQLPSTSTTPSSLTTPIPLTKPTKLNLNNNEFFGPNFNEKTANKTIKKKSEEDCLLNNNINKEIDIIPPPLPPRKLHSHESTESITNPNFITVI